MLHPERYEKAEEVLTPTPSGDTEFNTAQQAGSTDASESGPGPEAPGRAAGRRRHSSEELWDDSFKAPSTLERANSPTSTLADRFVSAGETVNPEKISDTELPCWGRALYARKILRL